MDDSSGSSSTLTLQHLLLNSLVSDNLYQYLPRASIFLLSQTNRQYRELVLSTPRLFRYLDLANSKGAYAPAVAPLDNGGQSWRVDRIDDNLSWDEFCSAPLRSVFNKLEKLRVLQDVQSLVLDGLGSVTYEILTEIMTSDRYNIQLLSIRLCPNINQIQLQKLLNYICRPSRPEGTPRIKGIYYFTDPINDSRPPIRKDATSSILSMDGATLGASPVNKALMEMDNAHRWYSAAGRIISIGADTRTSWEETIQNCSGVIAFDAILCRAMHEHMAPVLHEASLESLTLKPGIPPMASVALGPTGCAGCGKVPDGTAQWGESDLFQFPLLPPAPWSGRLIDAVRPPRSTRLRGDPLIVSCKWCLVNRHCDSCDRWWCAECYDPKLTNKLKDLEALSDTGLMYLPTAEELTMTSESNHSTGGSIKVFNGFCVENCLVGEMMSGAGSMGMWA